GGDSAVADWRARGQHPEEHVAILLLRPSGTDVRDQCFSHHIGERISRPMSGLALRDLEPFAFPVDIVESEFSNLVCTQTIGHQQKKNGVIAPSPGGTLVHCFQHAAHLVPGDGPWYIGQTECLRHFNGAAQIVGDHALAVTEAEEYPDYPA